MGYYEKNSDGKLVPRQKLSWHPSAVSVKRNTEVDAPIKMFVTSSMTNCQLKFGSGSYDWIKFGSLAAGVYEISPIAWKSDDTDGTGVGPVVFIYGGK
tara:strand:+ start:3334 stop:3627 length:294 start_codon:yes stop_codon:yes gene_type:complete